MRRILDWLDDRFQERPWWMNLLMIVCAFLAYVYVPWDFFFKPVAEDKEAWFGLLLEGYWAKLTEPLHFLLYAAGAYGFWRMRSWMWPWASLWVAQLTIGMVLWPILYRGGLGGWALAIASGAVFGSIAWGLFVARDAFGPKPLRLRDRYGDWALITGASSGLGREFARALSREGMSCVLTARRADRLCELATELETAHGVRVRTIDADLATAEGQAALIRGVEDLPVGLLVNNAGFGLAGALERQDPARLREMVELNCHAPVALTRALLPGMVARARGGIIVVASVAGRQSTPLFSTYSATKAFDINFGEALWGELRDRNVDVVVLQPGPVATEFAEAARETRTGSLPEEAPDACVRYALEALGKQPSVVSGGWTTWAVANVSRIAPRWLVTLVAGAMYERQTPREAR